MEVHPLPFAHVAEGLVEPGGYQYYQVQVTDPLALLTCELQCVRGFGSVYINKDQVCQSGSRSIRQSVSQLVSLSVEGLIGCCYVVVIRNY